MSKFIGIRNEDKYELEKRAPLTPRHVRRLIEHYKLDIIVQSSPKRIFSEDEYTRAGAKISKDLKKCDVVVGIKEIPEKSMEAEKTYVFFSHVIKGQPYNMPMLRRMMELRCNLIDYERIVDDQGKRLIFFGRFAGIAGMINTMWALGLRLKEYGYDSRLLKIRQAHTYHSLAEAKEDLSAIGQLIAENGIPHELRPFTVGFTGYGNVSAGAQEILGLLPVKEITPEKLLSLKHRSKLPDNLIYKIIFKESDLVEPLDKDREFDLQDYYQNPDHYRSRFEKYIPHLSVLMNCMYWDARFPRLVTRDYLEKLFSKGRPKLTVIGDITCDPYGSIECTHKGTPIDDPIFVYNPFTREPASGHEGEGMLVMAVDILPSELPRDSSEAFGDMLVNFIKPIAYADYELPFEEIDLPKSVKKGMILLKGELTPEYKYLERYLDNR